MRKLLWICIAWAHLLTAATVEPGVEVLFASKDPPLLKGRRVGLITNQTGVDSSCRSTIALFEQHAKSYELVALFAPEHGLSGAHEAGKNLDHIEGTIPIYSLHGITRRPTEAMLENIDLLVFDIQDIGCRCYTYASTLLYVMEEAAKHNIRVAVLDRPNPLGGLVVDGPMLAPNWRSFMGYVNVPLLHGMTIGELARFYNAEYDIGCDLIVVAMRGWRRNMTFEQTGLPWIPTSPQIPTIAAAITYPSSILIGTLLTNVSIGIGTTLPFQVVGAPWIDADRLADALNKQQFSGVTFVPYHFRPAYGRFAKQTCHGVLFKVHDPAHYRGVASQFLLLGMIKTLYPQQFQDGLIDTDERRAYLAKHAGTEKIYRIAATERYIAWELIALNQQERKKFEKTRKKYLLY